QRPDGQQRLLVDAAGKELIVRAVAEEVRCDRPAGEGAEDQQDDEKTARDCDAVAAKTKPDLLPVAPRTNVDRFEITDLAVCLGGDRCCQPSGRRDELRTFGRGHPRAASYSTQATLSLAAS